MPGHLRSPFDTSQLFWQYLLCSLHIILWSMTLCEGEYSGCSSSLFCLHALIPILDIGVFSITLVLLNFFLPLSSTSRCCSVLDTLILYTGISLFQFWLQVPTHLPIIISYIHSGIFSIQFVLILVMEPTYTIFGLVYLSPRNTYVFLLCSLGPYTSWDRLILSCLPAAGFSLHIQPNVSIAKGGLLSSSFPTVWYKI